MLTAAWNSYSGPGRVAVSPVPPEAFRGYRRHPGLSLARPVTMAELRRHLATLDARLLAAELAALTYPHEPVVMGSAPAGVLSYRSELARWFAFNRASPVYPWSSGHSRGIDPVYPDHLTQKLHEATSSRSHSI